METLLYIDSRSSAGQLALSLPGMAVCPLDCLPEAKPRLAVIQAVSEERWNLAWLCARKKIPFALLDVQEDDDGKLDALKSCVHRNRVPAAILGSWRYIPAVAALKELVNTQCLGKITGFSATPPVTPLAQRRLRDLKQWLDAEKLALKECQEQEEGRFRILLEAENGTACADFTLDGQQGTMVSSILKHDRTRQLPPANPLVSELAILSLSTDGIDKIRQLPMLMNL